MLVFQLYKLFGYVPQPEFSRAEKCPKGDGIWDILGYYDPIHRIVGVCEVEVKKHSKELMKALKNKGFEVDEVRSYLTLRELTRLHEHIHALIHLGDFKGFIAPNNEWYIGLRPEINEPLTVFTMWLILQRVNDEILSKAFEVMDQRHPKPYQDWIKLWKLARNKDVKAAEYVVGILKIAREKDWSSLDELINELNTRWVEIEAITIAFIISLPPPLKT